MSKDIDDYSHSYLTKLIKSKIEKGKVKEPYKPYTYTFKKYNTTILSSNQKKDEVFKKYQKYFK